MRLNAESLGRVLGEFVLAGRKGHRFGPHFCQVFNVCDPLIARQPNDLEAYELICKRWLREAKSA